MATDIHEILNGIRDYQFYAPNPSEPDTLPTIERYARDGVYNGPEGNETILRLLEIIKALGMEWEPEVVAEPDTSHLRPPYK
jgi:hypothetical protein